jgi:hypothetical protein
MDDAEATGPEVPEVADAVCCPGTGVAALGDETGVGVMSHPIKLENTCPVGRGQGSHAWPDELILVLPLPHWTGDGGVTMDGAEATGPEVPEVAGPEATGSGVPEATGSGVPEVAGSGVPDKYTPRTTAKITKQHTTTISIITRGFINILKYLNVR